MTDENDEYSEEEEEEILLYVEFEELSKQSMKNNDKILKIIGLDTEKPILQLGNNIYEGEYTNSCGTHVLFEEDDNPKRSIKPVTKPEPEEHYKYSTKTDKVLHMKRIFVREKNLEEQIIQDSAYKFPETYEKALQELVQIAEKEKLINISNLRNRDKLN